MDEMTAAEALAELKAAGYEHAAIWTQARFRSATIYLNNGPINAQGKRTGGRVESASWHSDTFRCSSIWTAIHNLIVSK